jgi:malonyl-CoA decarboxylase
VVQELQADFPSIKQFVTLSPIPGFKRWLDSDADAETGTDSAELVELKTKMRSLDIVAENVADHEEAIRKLVLNYLLLAKKGKYPLDPVARFHLGNGAQVHQIHASADLSDKGLAQSYGTMVNYLYDLRYIERNHEQYVTEGNIEFNDKLKASLLKS